MIDWFPYSHLEAAFFFQPICKELDKHGAWQQLGTKGVWFSSQEKPDHNIYEGEEHLEDVTMGGQGDTLPCPSGQAFTIFWGHWRGIQVRECGHCEFKIFLKWKASLYQYKWIYGKVTKAGGLRITFFQCKYLSCWERLFASICRSYIDKPASLGRQYDLIIGNSLISS